MKDLEPVERKLKSLEKQVLEFSKRADDFENRGRRNNVCIVGRPEGAKVDDPTRFSETWLPKTLNIEAKLG